MFHTRVIPGSTESGRHDARHGFCAGGSPLRPGYGAYSTFAQPEGEFRLLYLWYDVLGNHGKQHRDEVAGFVEVAKADGINFHSLTYQKLIVIMSNELMIEYSDYLRYLTQRYL